MLAWSTTLTVTHEGPVYLVGMAEHSSAIDIATH
jgi:hypothetical protein